MQVKRIYYLTDRDVEMIMDRLKELNMGKSDLAKAMRISRQQVEQYLTFIRPIKYDKVIKIQEILELKLEIEGEIEC